MKYDFSQNSDTELFSMLSGEKKRAESAFAELYARHASRVFAYCRRFLNDANEAQDVFQEVFVKFFESAKQDREMANVPGFLLTIARNHCLNLLRGQKPVVSFEDYMAVNQPNHSAESDELLNLITMAIDLLQPDYKEVFILREYEDFSYQEIADITNTTVSTVKIRIYRAKQKLREILQPYMADLIKHEK